MSMTHDDVTRAARTMTAVDPPQDLEARIKQRLDAVAHTRPTIRRWPVVAGVVTAVAAVVIAITVRSPEVPVSRGTEVRGEVPGARDPVVLESRGPEVPESAGPARAPIRLPAYRTVSESELAWMSRRVPALDLIDPIQPEQVLIAPLTMTPLMTSPMVGDHDEGRQ